MVRVPAALDSSFWTAAHRADVRGQCLSRFELNVPRAVARELTFDPARQSRPYESQKRFRHLHGELWFPTSEPPPIGYPHGGEAEAIALAVGQGWVLLCNDRAACGEAARRSATYVTAPDFIAFLCEHRELAFADAHARLDAIRSISAREFVDSAETQMDRLSAARQHATDLSRRRATASRLPHLGPHRHGRGPGDERGA